MTPHNWTTVVIVGIALALIAYALLKPKGPRPA